MTRPISTAAEAGAVRRLRVDSRLEVAMTAETILIDWILPTIYLALTVAGVIALRRSV